MLSRLPITFTQLKAGNNSEKLKTEVRQLLYPFFRSKNLQNNSIKVYTTLFENGNNFYEYWILKIVKRANQADLNWIWQINLILKIEIKIWL